MIGDEENLALFLQYGARPPMIAQPTGRPVFQSRPAGIRYGGTNYWDNRPTKAEGKKMLEYLGFPFKILAPYAPPQVKPVLLGAPELADFLIEIDPLDKFQE